VEKFTKDSTTLVGRKKEGQQLKTTKTLLRKKKKTNRQRSPPDKRFQRERGQGSGAGDKEVAGK